ncbi:MAG: cob(I)yrinic acid a,c-diamide adenosyltransferase [Deltaproteobacteria bacterium]|nr:cob(I)yrinic acid a,c-diamide adenosyltransferase [Deltaproteobacteria bacterium]
MKTGLVHIYTGEGKGKTTSAVGLAARAAGQGFKVLFVQFFKEDSSPSGEKEFFKNSNYNIELVRSNCRHPIFTKGNTDLSFVKKSVQDTYELARKKANEGGVDLLVLDEIMSAINGGWIAESDLIDFLNNRPPHLEVVLTGRNAPFELVKIADYVTEMLKIKHPYDHGTPARKGIEF